MSATPPPAPDARALAEEWAYACAMVGYNPPPTLEDAFEAGWNTREGWPGDYRNPLAQIAYAAELAQPAPEHTVRSTPAPRGDA